MRDIFDPDWESQLQPQEKATRKEGNEEVPVVLLAGLQRLAREANIASQSIQIITPSDSMVQCIFSASFKRTDGSLVTFAGAADCNTKNTTGKFQNYPTAVAESRAEARCLRKALGIRTLSSEEIGLRENFGTLEASPSRKADSQMVVAIQKLCESRGLEVARVLDNVLETARASNIFELSELTTEEAQRAMAWLNNQKPAEKVIGTKEKRDARKSELLNRKGLVNEG